MALKIDKKTAFFIKGIVSTSILYLIFSKISIGKVLYLLKTINPVYFLTASLLYIIMIFISSVRWRLFLSEKRPIVRLFSLNMIGSFFNNLLPGVTGGDAIKIYYLYKDTKKSEVAVGSIFMDRFIGFTAIMLIGLIAVTLGLKKIQGTGIEWLVPIAVIAFIIASFIVFGLRIGNKFSKIAQFYEYFHMYLRQYRVLFHTFLLSLFVQFLGIYSVYLINLGLGADIAFVNILIFLPIIVTIAAVPISISGLGVREGAFVLLFGLVGTREEMALAVSFAWYLSIAITGLIGFFFYITYKHRDDQKRFSKSF